MNYVSSCGFIRMLTFKSYFFSDSSRSIAVISFDEHDAFFPKRSLLAAPVNNIFK